MIEAILPQTPLRRAAARAGGIVRLTSQLGVTRQSFYTWESQGGASATYAILIARLTGEAPHDVCAPQYVDKLDLITDYFAHRS